MNKEDDTELWDAQIRQDGEWISIYGPFDNLQDAEDVIDACIAKVEISTSFRIFPIKTKIK